MASFDYSFPEGYVSKDQEHLEFYYETADGKMPPLELPDHSQPFVLGQYQAYPEPLPAWNSDYEEQFAEQQFPPDRVLFDKVLNTRLPEDMAPEQYDQMIFLMETMRKNSPYREGVWQRPYSNNLILKLRRPEVFSTAINAKASAVASSLYHFVTDYVPNLPLRFLTWTLDRAPVRYEHAKLAAQELVTPPPPAAGMTYSDRITAWQIAREYDLEGTTAVVTGATSGIGKEVARSLASRGARLILPSRDVPACDQMAIAWRNEFHNSAIHCASCDLVDMNSVLAFLGELKASNVVPDLLVNAASVLKPIVTASHFGTANRAIGANLLGPMVLTEGIIGLIDEDLQKHALPNDYTLLSSSSTAPASISSSWAASPSGSSSPGSNTSLTFLSNLAPGINGQQRSEEYSPELRETRVHRIVHLTCSAFKSAALRSEEITADGLGSLTGFRAYNVSKLGAIAHAQHTAQWLNRSGKSQNVVINTVDPGWTSDTQLHQNTFFGWLYTRIGKHIRYLGVKTPERAAAPILRLLLDPACKTSNGLHYNGFNVAESPLSLKPVAWNVKFMNALEDLKERAIDVSVETVFKRSLEKSEKQIIEELNPKIEEMRQWYRRQSELFERSLELPRPEMMPTGLLDFRPPPPHEFVGSKPLGIGPHDAPLIGDELRSGWHEITDSYPIQIQELVRRRNLAAPKPSPEEQAAIDQTMQEFEALKAKIMEERKLKSVVTAQYADPIPRAAGETWWGWFKAKVDDLTRPTIHK